MRKAVKVIPLSNNSGSGDRALFLSDDRLIRRLLLGLIVSVLANILLWAGASLVVRIVPRHDFKNVEVTRVVVDKQGHKQEKIVTKKQIEKKLAVVKKEIVRKEIASRRLPPPPQGAHNRVLTALPSKNAPGDIHTALAGGNAALGQAIGEQNAGNAATNPPVPAPAPAPAPTPAPAPARVVAPPPPVKQEVVQPPPPAPKPVAKGPTKEAEALSTVQPNIPDDLRQQDFKTFVRVKVKIAPDGSFSVTLRTSSGNAEIDKLVVDALNKWKWKPALRDGNAVESTLFKFEFEVN